MCLCVYIKYTLETYIKAAVPISICTESDIDRVHIYGFLYAPTLISLNGFYESTLLVYSLQILALGLKSLYTIIYCNFKYDDNKFLQKITSK